MILMKEICLRLKRTGSDRLVAFDEEGNRLLISHQIAMAKKLDQFGTYLAQEQTKTAKNKGSRRLNNVPGGIRTPDRSLRRRMLYPAELLEQIIFSECSLRLSC